MARRINPVIFREYDIRGVIGDTLFADDARVIGAAYAQWLRGFLPSGAPTPLVHVGYDGRLSTPELLENLLAGLCSSGVRCAVIECGPTPLLYHSVFAHDDAAGGIMITGSHNPKNHNGFKLMRGRQSLFGAEIQELGRIAATIDPNTIPPASRSAVIQRSVLTGYILRLAKTLTTMARPLRVVWDPGNGAGAAVIPDLVKTLPGEHAVLNGTVDGNFPNHHPDPSVEANMQQLRDAVLAGGYDIGLAFDGDADRLGVVDDHGRILWGDQILLFLAEGIAARYPGQPIIADVKCSQVLFDGIAKAGGQPVVWKTGHSLIKAKMRELSAPLAGEMSGHIFIADDYDGFDDGIYAGLRFVQQLAARGEKLSAWLDRLPPSHSTPELRIACPDERKLPVIESVRQSLQAAGIEFSTIDGVRAQTADGWWLLRASNTQPALSLRAEASSAEGLHRLEAELEQRLLAAGLRMQSVGH